MKRKILQGVMCLLLVGMAWSCSNDSDTVMSDADSRNIRLKSNDVWQGPIAQETASGELILIADRSALINSFQAMLAAHNSNDPVKVDKITLVRKFATNNPNDSVVFVIGGGRSNSGSTVSSGVVLSGGGAGSGGMFIAPGVIKDGDPKSVSCWGCGTGCFLEYYDIDGHKVPYCDSAGCGPLCDRIFD